MKQVIIKRILDSGILGIEGIDIRVMHSIVMFSNIPIDGVEVRTTRRKGEGRSR